MDKHDTLLIACGTTESRKQLCSVLDEYYNLLEATNAQQAIQLYNQNVGCLAAILLEMPIFEALRAEKLETQDLQEVRSAVPVIVITPDESPETFHEAFREGVADVMPLDYDPYAMLRRIATLVELNLHKQHLETLVEEQSNALRHSNDAMVDALSSIIEYRSVESGQHILRIRHFTKILLEEVARCCPEYDLTDSLIRIISSASALHDVGKISIPDAILTKPGKLTDEEKEVMRSHSLMGCRILRRLTAIGNEEYLRYAHNICHYHHERWDGRGYPEGLAGDAIPICAQVVGLADAYDALTSKRVYKDAYSFDTAVNMILQGECGAFSPKLLECFKHVTAEYEALARAYADGLAPESETFDVELPGPSAVANLESMDRTWAKYQALVHYSGAFLLELDLDNGLFHLVYNPYPELISFQGVSSFADIRRQVLNEIVVPEQRDKMEEFIGHGIYEFIRQGLRRANFHFRFQSRDRAEGENFDITLLRINPVDSSRRTLAVLCRKAVSLGAGPEPDGENLRNIPALAGPTYSCRYDRDFTLMRMGNITGELSGFSRDEIREIYGDRLIELVVPEDRDMLRQEFSEQLSRGTSVVLEHRIRHKSGAILWVMNKSYLAVDEDGQEYLYCYLTNITASKRAADELRQRLSRYEIILSQTENVLFEWDMVEDSFSVSETWEPLFGIPPFPAGVRNVLMTSAFFHPDDLPLFFDRVSNLENGSPYEMVEVRISTAKGRYLWFRIRSSAIRDESGRLTKIVGVIINIDAEKQAEQALQDQAERDPLTKLLNKNAGRRQAEEYFLQFSRNVNCALLIIDLDHFKEVNDQYGHLFGDAVLTRAARLIKKYFRTQDIISRIGGDEFMVLMRGVSSRELVEKRCEQLLTIFRNTFQRHQYKLPLSCSIGIAMAPDHGSSYFDLFERADQALYEVKQRGRNGFAFYTPVKFSPRPSQHRISAVNNRIDSDEQPGLSVDNIVQYAFRRLYSATNVSASINDILALVGQQMNVSRVYIFENSADNRFCSNTYEWCNEGIQPEIRNLQNISYETDIPGYADNFDEQGIFYCPDISVLPKETYDIVAPQGIKSMLHCAIRDNGVFRGYIGFDECETQRFWTREQIDTLTYFSEMLSVFLLKQQAQARTAQRAAELSTILDNQNAWIYIVDPDTCELKYLNAKTRALAPGAAPGMKCYSALLGCNGRCEDCPTRNIHRDKTSSSVMHNRKFRLDVLAEATLIQWEGKESCLITCREIHTPVQPQPGENGAQN